MKKHTNALSTFVFIILTLCSIVGYAQGPFAPAAGLPGTQAIAHDSAAIVAWATGIELHPGYINAADTTKYHQGSNRATYGMPAYALGQAQGNSTQTVSLGDSGYAIVTFDRPIINGTGPDFAVFENGFAAGYGELATVAVSSNGTHFVTFAATSLTDTNTQIGPFDQLNPTNINNLAGKYRQGYGTPFDLDELKNQPNLDVNNIRFVKITDVIGGVGTNPGTYDAQGNRINDPYPTESISGGFDLEAVAVLNAGTPYVLSQLDTLPLAQADTFWNGSNGSGGFTDGPATYINNYNTAWASWNGFAYSNMRNDTTPGFANQYSAITAGGMHANTTNATNYAVAYPSPVARISFAGSNTVTVAGVYVTNATYTYLSMKNGDMFAKKFGGPNGTDPDYLKLSAIGYDAQGNPKPDSVHFYLADYRLANPQNNYIVKNWRWMDLTALGNVSEIGFVLQSSDVGQYGMNTPGYFCLDNLTIIPNTVTSLPNSPNNQNPATVLAYKPAHNTLAVETTGLQPGAGTIAVYNTQGQLLSQTPISVQNVPQTHFLYLNTTQKVLIVTVQNHSGRAATTILYR